MSQNPNRMFWLARYAHNTLDPLLKQAKEFEPSLHWTIELNFADQDSRHYKYNFININAFWSRDGMFLYETHLVLSENVDRVARKVQAFIDKESAKVGAAA